MNTEHNTAITKHKKTLHLYHHDIHVLQFQIKQETNKINNWMLYNKLSINHKKLFYACCQKVNKFIQLKFFHQLQPHSRNRMPKISGGLC